MKRLLCLILSVMIIFGVAGCDNGSPDDNEVKRVADTRSMSVYDYTVANMSATDREGRTVRTGDGEDKESYVGLFYHIWQGYHTKNYKHVNDITKLLKENPDALYDIDDNPASPMGEFYFWGEPLYGYYCAYDPWLLTRHAELLTMAGVDYLVCDLTNSVIYYEAIDTMFDVFQAYYDMGWDVPKIAFYTNSYSAATVRSLYSYYYAKNEHPDLWFSFNGKPLIIGRRNELGAGRNDADILEFFDLRESQWPNGETSLDLENGFPWMEWEFPQRNFNGTMSVSLAQHLNARMSEKDESNNGRGFDYAKYRNISANSSLGTNLAGQWETVFKNNENASKKRVNNVFVTGFNEWQAIKMEDGNKVFFVDTFNEEYSRDIEMMKGGYGDNFYLQFADLVKRFKYGEAKRYIIPQNTIDIGSGDAQWTDVKSVFKDFTGDALARDYADAFGTGRLTDNSNRNDIASVTVTHDAQSLYVRVETAEAITAHNGSDLNWMNLLIKTDDDLKSSFAGFKYIVNRTPNGNTTSVEKSAGGYNWQTVAQAQTYISGNVMYLAIPLLSLGLTADNCRVQVKATDNVTHYDDITDYYVTGDSAPIGRLAYYYGY